MISKIEEVVREKNLVLKKLTEYNEDFDMGDAQGKLTKVAFLTLLDNQQNQEEELRRAIQEQEENNKALLQSLSDEQSTQLLHKMV